LTCSVSSPTDCIPTALAGAGLAFVIRIEHKAWDRVLMLVDAAAISLSAVLLGTGE